MTKYIDLTNENFEEITSEGVVMVDFWAKWCSPCMMLSPVIEELAEDFEGKAKICKVNVDENQELAQKFAVRSIPYIVFMKNGEVVDQLVGGHGKEAFASRIDDIL